MHHHGRLRLFFVSVRKMLTCEVGVFVTFSLCVTDFSIDGKNDSYEQVVTGVEPAVI